MTFAEILPRLLTGTAIRREPWPPEHYIALPDHQNCAAAGEPYDHAPLLSIRNNQWQDYAELHRSDLLAGDWETI